MDTKVAELVRIIAEGAPDKDPLTIASYMTGLDTGLRLGLTKPVVAQRMLNSMRAALSDSLKAMNLSDQLDTEEAEHFAELETAFGPEPGAN